MFYNVGLIVHEFVGHHRGLAEGQLGHVQHGQSLGGGVITARAPRYQHLRADRSLSSLSHANGLDLPVRGHLIGRARSNMF